MTKIYTIQIVARRRWWVTPYVHLLAALCALTGTGRGQGRQVPRQVGIQIRTEIERGGLMSRNKREGYYAGYYRPPHEPREKRRHRRWDAWAMSEFYPPRFGCIWKLLEKEGRL